MDEKNYCYRTSDPSTDKVYPNSPRLKERMKDNLVYVPYNHLNMYIQSKFMIIMLGIIVKIVINLLGAGRVIVLSAGSFLVRPKVSQSAILRDVTLMGVELMIQGNGIIINCNHRTTTIIHHNHN